MEEENTKRMERTSLTDLFFNEFFTNLYYVLDLHKSISKRTRKSVLLTMRDSYLEGTVVLVKDNKDGLIHPDVLENNHERY